MGFVMGEAHVAAIQSTPEVSRGGSITSTWRLGDLEQVAFDAVADHLPHLEHNRIDADGWAERIAARQRGFAERMLG